MYLPVHMSKFALKFLHYASLMTDDNVFSDWWLFSGLFAQPMRRPQRTRHTSLFHSPQERSELLLTAVRPE